MNTTLLITVLVVGTLLFFGPLSIIDNEINFQYQDFQNANHGEFDFIKNTVDNYDKRIGYESEMLNLWKESGFSGSLDDLEFKIGDKFTKFSSGYTSIGTISGLSLDQRGGPVIFIDGNDDLVDFPGSGTAEDPFVISEYSISSTSSFLVMQNTDAHVWIVGNTFNGNGNNANYGIQLTNVQNVIVQDNYLSQASVGVSIVGSSNVQLLNNDITENYLIGLEIIESTSGSIFENSITNNLDGFALIDSTGFVIISNSFKFNDYNGVSFANSPLNQVYDNSIEWNGQDGFSIEDSDQNILGGNYIAYNGYFVDPCSRGCGPNIQVTQYNGEFPGQFYNAFTAEGRIGDTIHESNSLTYELDISESISGPFDEGESANYIWESGAVIPFEVYYDYEIQSFILDVDGTIVNHISEVQLSSINDILFRTTALYGSSVTISDVYLNYDYALDFTLESSLQAGDPNTVEVNTNGLLSEEFHIGGNVKFDFWNTSQGVENSDLAFQISFGQVVNEGELANVNSIELQNGEYNLNALTGIGLYLDPSFDNVVEGNIIENNAAVGFYLQSSDNTVIAENHIGFNGLSGLFLEDSDSNTIQFNNLVGNGLYAEEISNQATVELKDRLFLRALTGIGLYLDPSFDNIVTNNNIEGNSGMGVYLEYSNGTTISGNSVRENGQTGVFLFDSSHNTLSGNEISNNGYGTSIKLTGDVIVDLELRKLNALTGIGLYLDPAVGNTVTGNEIYGNAAEGIMMELSSNSIIDSNVIYANQGDGVFLLNSTDNQITNNQIVANGFGYQQGLFSINDVSLTALTGIGLFLDPSSGNLIEGNYIADNAAVGMYLLDTDNTVVNENVFEYNGLYGVFLENSDQNNITYNQIKSNGAFGQRGSLNLNALTGIGLFLDPSFDNVVEGNDVSGNDVGMYLLDTDRTTIESNSFSTNGIYGVFLENSDENTIRNNTIADNGGSTSEFGLTALTGIGLYLDPSFDNVVEGNDVSGNAQVGLHLLETDRTEILQNNFDSNGVYGVFLENSNNNRLAGNSITNNGGAAFNVISPNALTGIGLYLDPSFDNVVEDNYVAGNSQGGVHLFETNNTSIEGNIIDSNGVFGVFLEDSSTNSIVSNEISNNGFNQGENIQLNALTGIGLYLDPSFDNIIQNNIIDGNFADGLQSEASGGTLISGNEFSNNGQYGVNLDATSFGSTVASNNFLNNGAGVEGAQAKDDNTDGGNSFSTNFFDDADLTDENGDGIADNPYILDGSAENSDSSASTTPYVIVIGVIGVNLDMNPRKITIGGRNNNNYFIVVTLPTEYVVENAEKEDFLLNGSVQPIEVKFDEEDLNSNQLRLKFDKDDIEGLVMDYFEENDFTISQIMDTESVTLELTGIVNGDVNILGQLEAELKFHRRRGGRPIPISILPVIFALVSITGVIQIRKIRNTKF